MSKTKKIIMAAAVAALAGLAAGCASPQYDDLKGISPVYPDYAVVVMNVDGFPNYTILCYDDVPEITTTRDYTSITYAPQYQNICDAHKRNDLSPSSGFTPPAGG